MPEMTGEEYIREVLKFFLPHTETWLGNQPLTDGEKELIYESKARGYTPKETAAQLIRYCGWTTDEQCAECMAGTSKYPHCDECSEHHDKSKISCQELFEIHLAEARAWDKNP